MELELMLAQEFLPVAEEAEVTFLLRLLPDSRKKKTDYPLDIRFVLDRSGSMGDQAGGTMTKIEALKKAISQSLGILRTGKDRISIIVYDDDMKVLVDPRVISDIDAVKKLINQITTGNMTHLSSPLRYALEISSQKDALPKVIIFTDGIVNHPSAASEERECLNLAKQAKKAAIPLAVFGTGVDYNETFLKQLAETAGHGSYFEHVRQVGAMRLRLEEDFENLKGTQERDVAVTIKADPIVSILEAIKYVPQQLALSTDGKSVSDDFPGLDARGQAYLIKCNVKSNKYDGLIFIGTVTVNWKGVAGSETASIPVSVNFTTDPKLISPVDKTVLNTVLNTEAVKATLQGKTKRAETLFTKAGNQEMLDQLKTLGVSDEDAQRTLRTMTTTQAHKGLRGAKKDKGEEDEK